MAVHTEGSCFELKKRLWEKKGEQNRRCAEFVKIYSGTQTQNPLEDVEEGNCEAPSPVCPASNAAITEKVLSPFLKN